MEDLAATIAALQKKIRQLKNALQSLSQESLKYRRAMKHTQQGVLMLDRRLSIIEVNPALLAMCGLQKSELIGKRLEDFYDQSQMEFYSASHSHLSFEATLSAADGRRVVALFNRSALRNGAGRIVGYIILVSDLSELKEAQEELRKAEKLYHSMYRKAVQGMFQSTISGDLIRMNPAYARILGYDSPDELLGQKGVAARLFEDPAERVKMIKALRKKGFLANYEVKLRRADGKPVWALANYHLNRNEAGEPIIEGILVDHSYQKQLEERLRRSREKFRNLSLVDNLTGLYNTRYLYQALDRLVVESLASARPFALIFMDMDHFKRVVDTFGHLNGSRALREVALTIRATIRRPCFGVAYGGDEFVVVLPGFDRRRAMAKADAIRSKIRRTTYLTAVGLAVKLEASFGLAAFPGDARDRYELLALADQALFRIKQTAKGGIGTVPTP